MRLVIKVNNPKCDIKLLTSKFHKNNHVFGFLSKKWGTKITRVVGEKD